MARTWLAVDKNGAEKIFNVKPFRGNAYYKGHSIDLPKGTIVKLIGRNLTWKDECVEFKKNK